jgi:hypothetical protein
MSITTKEALGQEAKYPSNHGCSSMTEDSDIDIVDVDGVEQQIGVFF